MLIYQLVHLTEHGEARKVSKRRGDVVLLDELPGRNRRRRGALVPRQPRPRPGDRDRRRPGPRASDKNPVYYVQYAHARIAGILRNADSATCSSTLEHEPERGERELVKRLAEFPAVVAEATERRGPHAIPIYAVRLADDFHRFYHDCRVLGSEEPRPFASGSAWRREGVLARCLDLVGVEAPERM